MTFSVSRHFVLYSAILGALLRPAFAQAPASDPRAGDAKPPAIDAARDTAARRADAIAETSRTLTGPAANAECIWLGQRVVGLLWRDDLDTAFRHLDLYDRFGCPGGHVQLSFRCVVKQGNIDPKAAETLAARVDACWINPALPPTPAAVAAPSPAAGGTTNR